MALETDDPQVERYRPLPELQRVSFGWARPAIVGVGIALIVYLCWRIVIPFLPALSWAFALALIAQPIYSWLLRRGLPGGIAALTIVILVLVVVVGPGAILVRALVGEASDVVNRVANDTGAKNLRETIENNQIIGPALRWLDSRIDVPGEAMQLTRSVATLASATLSAFLTGLMWLLSQVAVTLFVLFYFLRDREKILNATRSLLPLPASAVDAVFCRIAQTIRVSLGSKIVVASIQGTLGGLIFFWLGLPAPVFWGTVMAALSIFPVIGAFVIWLPAAAIFALQGDWRHALLLTGWGVIIIHPVDNLLGPVLVGAALRLHTLLMFFSVIGGIAAFGASGVVLGPVTVACLVALFELKESLTHSNQV